jgi:8-oxo-dGTP diphosphatase
MNFTPLKGACPLNRSNLQLGACKFENYSNGMKHIHVTCAIIERNGLVLAAQRSKAMSLPLKWEFPGGKINLGESPEDCLRREIIEEMGIQICVEESLPTSTHQYPSFNITLYPFVCTIASGEIVLHEHSAINWLPAVELYTLDWAEADVPVIESYLTVSAGLDSVMGFNRTQDING